MDAAGNLYGTTLEGGKNGYGVVFKLAPDGTETVLYAFKGSSDGGAPGAGAPLIADKKGNLYGTSPQYGNMTACSGGCGVVYEVMQGGKEKVLWSFNGGQYGYAPQALIWDPKAQAGALYGTTSSGGTYGGGMVFTLTK